MKTKALSIFLVFTIGLLPFPTNQTFAQVPIKNSIDDAAALMYISDALLLDVDFPEEVFHSPGLSSPSQDNLAVDPDNAALAAALHAAKAERNDLDAKCNLSVSQLRAQGKDCEADRIKSQCDQRRQAINAKIGKLHDLRGDRRSGPTRIWHWLKRSGRGFWYRIGPVGRNFLRQVGPEALKIVASGGSLSLDVAKNLLKHTAKSMLRDRIRPAMLHGIERLLQGQIEIAQAAGVDICDPEEETPDVQSSEISNDSASSISDLDIAPNWTCSLDTGQWWDTYVQGGDPNNIVEKSELIFNLHTYPPDISYDLTFHGIGRIALYSAQGNLYDYIQAEDRTSGKGVAVWDETYFYGSFSYERKDYLTYPSKNTEEEISSHEFAVIGALTPVQDEIHICFHQHTREQFESIKEQPFENLLINCSNNMYFECTPE